MIIYVGQGHFKLIALDKAFAAKWDRPKKDGNEAELLSAGRLIEGRGFTS
jgi:hypothetical protein